MNKRKTKELVRDAIFIIAIIVLAIFNLTARCNNKTDEKVVKSTPLPAIVTTATTSSTTTILTTKTTASTQASECSLTTSTLTNSSINTSTIVTTTICEVTEVKSQPIVAADLNRSISDFCVNEPVKLQLDNTKIQNPVPNTNVETTQILTTMATITTTTEQITTVAETSVITTVTTTKIKNDITNDIYVYKPSTHFVHRMTCKWYDETCEIIDTTEGLNVLYCIDCNPDIEIFSYYQAVQPVITDVSVTEIPVYNGIDDYDRELLAQIVWHEAGSDWISTYDKAMVAAGVMNRVNDSRFPSTVYDVLTQPGQFTGYWPDCCTPTQSCYDAVDYYFNNISLFGNHNSWYGVNGQYNVFYYQ